MSTDYYETNSYPDYIVGVDPAQITDPTIFHGAPLTTTTALESSEVIAILCNMEFGIELRPLDYQDYLEYGDQCKARVAYTGRGESSHTYCCSPDRSSALVCWECGIVGVPNPLDALSIKMAIQQIGADIALGKDIA